MIKLNEKSRTELIDLYEWYTKEILGVFSIGSIVIDSTTKGKEHSIAITLVGDRIVAVQEKRR